MVPGNHAGDHHCVRSFIQFIHLQDRAFVLFRHKCFTDPENIALMSFT